jgi:hypothetical protein
VDGPHSSYPRTWSRSASRFGPTVDTDSLARRLQQQWSPAEYPVHIHIVGGRDGAGIRIRIWNSTGIHESEIVYPADQADAEDPVASAVGEEVASILHRLQREGKLLQTGVNAAAGRRRRRKRTP